MELLNGSANGCVCCSRWQAALLVRMRVGNPKP